MLLLLRAGRGSCCIPCCPRTAVLWLAMNLLVKDVLGLSKHCDRQLFGGFLLVSCLSCSLVVVLVVVVVVGGSSGPGRHGRQGGHGSFTVWGSTSTKGVSY